MSNSGLALGVRGVPYGVYFRIIADELVVLAVMHGRRFPRRWQSRRGKANPALERTAGAHSLAAGAHRAR